jgi:hypothetical protein
VFGCEVDKVLSLMESELCKNSKFSGIFNFWGVARYELVHQLVTTMAMHTPCISDTAADAGVAVGTNPVTSRATADGIGAEADAVSVAQPGWPGDEVVVVVRVSRLDSLKASAREYKGKLAAVPTRWKVVWVLGIAVWAPLAYTVLLIVPGSMVLFTVAWTTFVLRYGSPKRVADGQDQEGVAVYEDDDEEGDNELQLFIPHTTEPTRAVEPSLYEGDNDWCGNDEGGESKESLAPLLLLKKNGKN